MSTTDLTLRHPRALTESERCTAVAMAEAIAAGAAEDEPVANTVLNTAKRWPDASLRMLGTAICLWHMREQAEESGGFWQ
jgi:hypothetical protein